MKNTDDAHGESAIVSIL